MNTTYADPLIPPHETSDETLTRLSANMGTLTGLMDASERRGLLYLAGMFSRSRGTKVAEAEAMIARLNHVGKAAHAPVGLLFPPWEIPVWKDTKPALQDAGELPHVGAGEFVIERRFLLVGNAVSDNGVTALSCRDQPRRQLHRRADARRRFLSLLTDPRFLQLALA